MHLNVEPVEDEHQLSGDAVDSRKFIGDGVQLSESNISYSLETKEVDDFKQLRRKEADNEIANASLKANTRLKIGFWNGAFPRSSLLENVAAFTTQSSKVSGQFSANMQMTASTYASTFTATPMW